MGLPKVQRAALTLTGSTICLIRAAFITGRWYSTYLERADTTELNALIVGARELKAEYGDLDGIIKAAEGALRNAGGK